MDTTVKNRRQVSLLSLDIELYRISIPNKIGIKYTEVCFKQDQIGKKQSKRKRIKQFISSLILFNLLLINTI